MTDEPTVAIAMVYKGHGRRVRVQGGLIYSQARVLCAALNDARTTSRVYFVVTMD